MISVSTAVFRSDEGSHAASIVDPHARILVVLHKSNVRTKRFDGSCTSNVRTDCERASNGMWLSASTRMATSVASESVRPWLPGSVLIW